LAPPAFHSRFVSRGAISFIAKGVTSYFDDLIVLRAGLATQEEYLGLLGKMIQQVEDSPGRLLQTLKDSSFDTWIKYYRPDENAIDSRISYYTKGALVAFLLDVHIRILSDDRYSLADVMRQLWQRCRVSGYTLSDFESIASELAGADLTEWFDKHVRRSDQPDYQTALDWLGLKLDPSNAVSPSNSVGMAVSNAKTSVPKPE